MSGLLAAVAVLVASLAGVVPTSEPDVAARLGCVARADRDVQVVSCRGDGLPPDGFVDVAVGLDDGDALGGAPVGPDGTVVVETAVACDVDGVVPVQVRARDADGEVARHTEDVTLAGRCRGVWELTGGQWLRLAAAVAGAVAVVVLAWWARRRARARRRRRPVTRRRGPRRSRKARRRGAGPRRPRRPWRRRR